MPIRMWGESQFVPCEPQYHNDESFMAATQELVGFIEGFVTKHGVGVVVGFAAPAIENPKPYEGAFVLAHPPLATVALERLKQAVANALGVNTYNERNKN